MENERCIPFPLYQASQRLATLRIFCVKIIEHEMEETKSGVEEGDQARSKQVVLPLPFQKYECGWLQGYALEVTKENYRIECCTGYASIPECFLDRSSRLQFLRAYLLSILPLFLMAGLP